MFDEQNVFYTPEIETRIFQDANRDAIILQASAKGIDGQIYKSEGIIPGSAYASYSHEMAMQVQNQIIRQQIQKLSVKLTIIKPKVTDRIRIDSYSSRYEPSPYEPLNKSKPKSTEMIWLDKRIYEICQAGAL